MVEHYYTSIGRNTNLLIGMVIDPRGLVPQPDALRFAEFGDRMKQILSHRVGVAYGTGNIISLPIGADSAPNSLDSPYANGGAAGMAHLLTDDPKTYWHTYHNDKTLSAAPHEVVLDMGREMDVAAFTLLPRDDGTCEGTPDQFAFYLSRDGKDWTLATEGEWTDMRENSGMHTAPLEKPMTGRYLRFIAKHAVDDCDYVIVAGIGAIETKRQERVRK